MYQVLQLCNPHVVNQKKESFVALVPDSLPSISINGFEKKEIEVAIKGDAALGAVHDTRYFLRDDVVASSIQGQPKANLKKMRCCIINKTIIDKQILLQLEGKINSK